MSASVTMMEVPAAAVGSKVGWSSCQLSYRTCHTSVPILETS